MVEMQRYSQLYIEKGNPFSDSPRFRNRLAAFVLRRCEDRICWEIYNEIKEKIGPEILFLSGWTTTVGNFLQRGELRDILDSITVVYNVLLSKRVNLPLDRGPIAWRSHVETIINEENLRYRIDELCIVHPHIDFEFEKNRTSSIASLDGARFNEARADLEAAYLHLRNDEGKQAIRMMFPAVETTIKVLFPGMLSRLMPNEVDKILKPLILSRYHGNDPAIESGNRMMESFKDWIIASQPYRHGQEVQDCSPPPIDLVVAFISAGAMFVRWIVDLSGQRQ
jgi:hypothetical protein